MKYKPHAKNLRKGRHSEPNQIYSITTVTIDRKPVFTDLYAARRVITVLRQEQRLQRAETLAYVLMPDHLHWLMQLGMT